MKENQDNLHRINGIYKSTIEQVLVIESCKKDISMQILMVRDEKRWSLIQEFLEHDLQKHLLLEQAAVVAINNGADTIVDDLENLYQHTNGPDLITKIRTEYSQVEKFIKLIKKGRKHKDWLSFTERRAMQEISKFVLEQAREYNKL
ncbi:MAG: hypothetical protein KBG91_08315 [Syntrophomonadaceae bacterium]|nr:hypothetical protein [Syntrophomonadaceae bacterium]